MSERKSHYSDYELTILINLIDKFKKEIENKRTDPASKKRKDLAWIRIANAFNRATEVQRGPPALRGKYENLKRALRKKISDCDMKVDRVSQNLTPYEEKMKSILTMPADRSMSNYVSDHISLSAEDPISTPPMEEIYILSETGLTVKEENLSAEEDSASCTTSEEWPSQLVTDQPASDKNDNDTEETNRRVYGPTIKRKVMKRSSLSCQLVKRKLELLELESEFLRAVNSVKLEQEDKKLEKLNAEIECENLKRDKLNMEIELSKINLELEIENKKLDIELKRRRLNL